MYRIDIENTKNGNMFRGEFKTLEELNKWKDKHLNKQTWGLEENLIIGVPEDITQEIEDMLAEKEARKVEIEQIKLAISLIDGSSKPAWEKKLLKRLIEELN